MCEALGLISALEKSREEGTRSSVDKDFIQITEKKTILKENRVKISAGRIMKQSSQETYES
jgi:hypothetical protein